MGGPIGSELTQAFARLGSQVTQVEMGSQILAREDEEVIELVTQSFIKDGVNLLTNHKAKAFREGVLVCEHEGQDVEVPFDKVIVALGRKANVQGFWSRRTGHNLKQPGHSGG